MEKKSYSFHIGNYNEMIIRLLDIDENTLKVL